MDHHAIETGSMTIAAILKMVQAHVEARDIPLASRGQISSEIASNTNRLLVGLQTINPSFNVSVAQLFTHTLNQPPEVSLDLYQLEASPDGSSFLNVSERFVDTVLRDAESDIKPKRRGCPAGRVVVNEALIPDHWNGLDVVPLVESMYQTALDTAGLFYQGA